MIITFNRQNFSLETSEKKSVSLVELTRKLSQAEEIKFWQKAQSDLGVQLASCTEFDLGDLFCRLERSTFLIALKQFWSWADDFAILKIHLPHPRHDLFLNDFGYVNGILPEAFLELDPQNSTLGLHQQLGVRFEIQETQFEFDPIWQNEKIEDLERISKIHNNVIAFFQQKIVVRKSSWVETTAENLNQQLMTPDMERQLREQYQSAVARGDLQSAQVIQKFLTDNNK